MRVAAIVLAAGASTRLGHPKQLVRLGGEHLLERAVRIAGEAGCEPVIVVLGSQAEVIASQCDLSSALVVQNAQWQEGMASSIRIGMGALPSTASATIVMTCDQPAVSGEHLRALMEAGRDEPVVSVYTERTGIPACLPRSAFEMLETLTGNVGARVLLKAAKRISLPLGEIDVDTVEALETARRLFE